MPFCVSVWACIVFAPTCVDPFRRLSQFQAAKREKMSTRGVPPWSKLNLLGFNLGLSKTARLEHLWGLKLSMVALVWLIWSVFKFAHSRCEKLLTQSNIGTGNAVPTFPYHSGHKTQSWSYLMFHQKKNPFVLNLVSKPQHTTLTNRSTITQLERT